MPTKVLRAIKEERNAGRKAQKERGRVLRKGKARRGNGNFCAWRISLERAPFAFLSESLVWGKGASSLSIAIFSTVVNLLETFLALS